MKQLSKIVTLSALLFGGFASAYASSLLPGQTAPPDIFFPTASTLAQVSGTATAATFSDSYTVGVSSDTSNVFCSGCLDFYFYFTNHGADVNERFSSAAFTGFLTDVGYVGYAGGPGTNNPTTVDRSASGSVIGFNYIGTGELNPGQTTSILVIETNATVYNTGMFSIQDGSTVTVAGFEPTTVPEPASLALLGTGLLGAVGVIRRRYAK